MYKLFAFSKIGVTLCKEELKVNMGYREIFPKNIHHYRSPEPFYVMYIDPYYKTYYIVEERYVSFLVEAEIGAKLGYKATVFLNRRIKNFKRI